MGARGRPTDEATGGRERQKEGKKRVRRPTKRPTDQPSCWGPRRRRQRRRRPISSFLPPFLPPPEIVLVSSSLSTFFHPSASPPPPSSTHVPPTTSVAAWLTGRADPLLSCLELRLDGRMSAEYRTNFTHPVCMCVCVCVCEAAGGWPAPMPEGRMPSASVSLSAPCGRLVGRLSNVHRPSDRPSDRATATERESSAVDARIGCSPIRPFVRSDDGMKRDE